MKLKKWLIFYDINLYWLIIFKERSYTDYTGPSEYSMGANGAQRSKFGQNFEQDDFDAEPRAKKRDVNDFKSNSQMDDQSRIKKHRWDSVPDNGGMKGGAPPNLMSAPVRPSNGYNNYNNSSSSNGQNGYSNGNSYNNNGNYNNGHSNGGPRSLPVNGNSYSNGSNGSSAIPKLSSLVVQPPPPPPSAAPSSAMPAPQPGMYPPEYAQMYSLQYYQAIAASAAKNGGNWQTAATNLWTQPTN